MTKGSQHHLDLIKFFNMFGNRVILRQRSMVNFSVIVDSSYASHSDRKSHYGSSVHMNSIMYEASKMILLLRQLLFVP